MKTVVVFNENGARIYCGDKAKEMASHPEALIDPEFPPGVAPHLWCRSGNKIAVLAQTEDGAKKFRNGRLRRRILSVGIGFALGVATGLCF